MAAHSHSHTSGGGPAPKQVRIALAIALAPFVLASVIGLIWLRPSSTHATVAQPGLIGTGDLHDATVLRAETRPCGQPAGTGEVPGAGEPGAPPAAGGFSVESCADVAVVIKSGPETGSTIELPTMSQGVSTPALHEGDSIMVTRDLNAQTGEITYNFADLERRGPLVVLGLVFAVIVIVVARLRGLTALVALAMSGLLIVFFVIPAILEEKNPVAVALTAATAMMFIVLYMSHGVSVQTSSALLGTLVSLWFIGGLSVLFVGVTRLTGMAEDATATLVLAGGNVPLTGLLLAGMIIGALGVLNDVTVTQASAVWEVSQANPSLRPAALYRSGMRVGRDHIASVVDTLVLAYAGASLPLLILFTQSRQSFVSIVTSEVVAVEVVRTLVGSIGLVASVPITTALAAYVVWQCVQVSDANTGAGADVDEALVHTGGDDHRELDETPRRARPDKAARPYRSKAEREFWSE